MRKPRITSLAALAATLALSACGSSSSTNTTTTTTQSAASTSTTSSEATVKAASNSKLGATVLVDAQGMTLYRLSGEQNGKFICSTGACTQIWRPLSVSAGATPTGVASLATVKRPDGAEQVTYKGEPLYTFAQDKAAGEANGQGIKDVGTWTAVTVASSSAGGETPATTTTTATTPAPSGSGRGGGGGGYGY